MTAATRKPGSRIEQQDATSYHYYYVKLTAQNPGDLFEKYPILYETVRNTWMGVMNVYPQVKPDAFNVKPTNLDAIICVADGFPKEEKKHQEGFFNDLDMPEEGIPDIVIEKAIDFFRSLCMHGWIRILHEEKVHTDLNFWDADYSVQELKDQNEVERIRALLIKRKL